MACRQEGRGERARGERELSQALPEAVSGFSGAQTRRDNLCVSGGAEGVGGGTEYDKLPNLRECSTYLDRGKNQLVNSRKYLFHIGYILDL